MNVMQYWRYQAHAVVTILALAGLLAFGWSPARAQEDQNLCGTLTGEDCALLIDSAQVMTGLRGGVFALDMEFGSSDLMLAELASIYVTIQGTFEGELPTEAATTREYIEAAAAGFSTDTSVIIRIPTSLALLLFPDTLTNTFAFDLRMVDGFAYLNADKILALDTTGSAPLGWLGLDVTELLITAVLQTGSFDALIVPSQPGEATGINDWPLARFNEVQRLANVVINEQSHAVFETHFAFTDALADAETRETVEATVREALGDLSFYTEAEIDQAVTAYADLLGGLSATVNRTIRMEDGYLHALTFAGDFRPDPTRIEAVAQSIDPLGVRALAFDLRFDFSIEFAQFNQPPQVIAPEDATIIPIEEILGTGA
jgi:hypothetical protein